MKKLDRISSALANMFSLSVGRLPTISRALGDRGNIRGLLPISRKLAKLQKQSTILVNDRIPSILNETNTFLKTQKNVLASEYNALADKYYKLTADRDKIASESARYQKFLDDAISWTILLQTPEKLSVNTVNRIFFETLFPELEAWGKNKTLEERLEIAQQMFLRVMVFYDEQCSNLIKDPQQANVIDMMYALASFVNVTFLFYSSFKIWYALNRSKAEGSRFYNAHYYLDQFFKEGIKDLSK